MQARISEQNYHQNQNRSLQMLAEELQHIPLNEIAARLKEKRNQIMNEEKKIKSNAQIYFNSLKNRAIIAQKSVLQKIDRSMLSFYEQLQQNMTKLERLVKQGKHQKEEESIAYGKDMNNIIRLLNKSFIEKQNLKIQNFDQALSYFYRVELTESIDPSFYDNTLSELLKGQQTQREITKQKQNFSEILIIQKLEDKIQRLMLNDQKLKSKIKSLEIALSRKGMKEMIKSGMKNLQENGQPISTWKIERIQQQNNILKSQILTASQKIMNLTSQKANLQSEVKRMWTENENTRRSRINSHTKSQFQNLSESIQAVSGNKPKSTQNTPAPVNQQILNELQQKNENLMNEINLFSHELKVAKDQIQKLQDLNDKLSNQLQLKEQSFQYTEQIYNVLNHDYELSMKKKGLLQKEVKDLKEQKQTNERNHQLSIETFKKLLELRQEESNSFKNQIRKLEDHLAHEKKAYQIQLSQLQAKKEELLERLENISEKKIEEEANWKSYLNQQILNLKKQVKQHKDKLFELEELNYDLKTKNTILITSETQLKEKCQNMKKEMTKIKKEAKIKDKQFEQIRLKLNQNIQIERKVGQIQQKFKLIQQQFQKFKQNADKRHAISQNRFQLVKQKISSQIGILLSNNQNKNMNKLNKQKQKQKGIQQTLQKYIQSVSNFALKNSQIKQLKDEIKQLKQGKQSKQLSKKLKSSDVNRIKMLQGDLYSVGISILQQKFKSERDVFNERIKYLEEMSENEERLRNMLEEELKRQRFEMIQIKGKFRSEETILKDKDMEIAKIKKNNQDTHAKISSELKSVKNKLSKIQEDFENASNELKNKNKLIVGYKSTIKDEQQKIQKLTNQLTESKEELDKYARKHKEIENKQIMYKDMKERYSMIEAEMGKLMIDISKEQQKSKMLTFQLNKKDDELKKIKNSKEISSKDQTKLKELNEMLDQQRDLNKKQKNEIDRKDELLNYTKKTNQTKLKQMQDKFNAKSIESQRLLTQLKDSSKRCDTFKTNYHKQQSKCCLYRQAIKRIYELYTQNVNKYQKLTQQNLIKPKYQLTSSIIKNSSAITNYSPNLMKTGLISSSLKPIPRNSQALQILQLTQQDLSILHDDHNRFDLTISRKQRDSTFSSPNIHKKSINNHENLLNNIEELQKIMTDNELNVNSILQIFKKIEMKKRE